MFRPLYTGCLKILLDNFLIQLLGFKDELSCRPVQMLVSQISAGEVVIPLVDICSDPDYINQSLVWMVRNIILNHCMFLLVFNSLV